MPAKRAPVSKIELSIPALRDVFRHGLGHDYAHTLESVTVVVTGKVKLYKTRDGMVLADRSTHLYDGWNMNDVVRRAWCKLSGVKFTDLKAAIAEHKMSYARQKAAERTDDLRRAAAKLGYRLVKH